MARAMLLLGIVVHLVLPLAAARPQRDASSEVVSTFRGVVLADNPSAMPLAGARVSLQTPSGSLDVAFADEQGRFVVRGRTSTEFVLAVTKPGFAGTRTVLTPASSRDPITVRLERGAVVIATIVDAGGEPAVAVGIGVRLQRIASSSDRDDANVYFADTDDRGELRIGSLPAGRYTMALTDSFAAARTGYRSDVPESKLQLDAG